MQGRRSRTRAHTATSSEPGFTDRQLLELGCELVAEFIDKHAAEMEQAK